MVAAEQTLVIGIGNPERQDDSIGIVIARKLKEWSPDKITAIEASGEATELIERFGQASKIIVVDAVCSGQEVGCIHCIDAIEKPIPTDWFSQYSTHDFGLAEAVELARNLGQLPQSLLIIGIEGMCFEMGTNLSPEVEDAIRPAIELILSNS
ncbi:hydrogenase maturation protease [Pelagicoccus mobilis]|uniref:Hydrogenase maturation protease n=1 Tax=Pelagicoccus mobilis TaxID=415221 RepID=A0A934RWU8_9BACT|nr:hydrogenase maturation protease [Pelagicoccus mobilis]MBK1876241.1 hydrogenase maturation protease [Pelagicoccus mobilis]